MKKCAIVQSSYIPWKGYFDLINSVDEFVLLDDVQYTKRDWRSRNQILTSMGLQWLTIPVETKGKYKQLIKDVDVCDDKWANKHWRAIEFNYRNAVFFDELCGKLAQLYCDVGSMVKLSSVNFHFISAVCQWLDIQTRVSWSMDYTLQSEECAIEKNTRLINICKAVGAVTYLSGSAASVYIDEDQFRLHGISVEYIDYNQYLPYQQCYVGYQSAVSIIDLLFNVGLENSLDYMTSNKKGILL